MDQKTAGTGQNAWSVLFGDVKFKPETLTQIKLMHMLSLDALIRLLKLVLAVCHGVGLVS